MKITNRKITNREVRKKLKAVWPKLRHIWLVDPEYWLPSIEELKKALVQSKVDQMQYRRTISDCDDFSLQLHADIKRMRITMVEYQEIPSEQWFPWAFGEVMGREFRGMKMLHAANICLTQEGIFLIEPRDDRIWKASSDNDEIFFVKI